MPTMTRQDSFGYDKLEEFAVAVPYSGGDLQLLVLLPDTAAGLPNLESKLTPALLMDCARLKNQDIVLFLTQFKLEPPLFELRKTLEGLGMETRSTSLEEAPILTVSHRDGPATISSSPMFFTKPSSRLTKRAPKPQQPLPS